MIKPMKNNWSALIPVAVAIAFAVFVIGIFGFEKVVFGDANDYMTAARTFLSGAPYPLRSEFHPMFRPPLYPLFIAGIWSVTGESAVAVKLAQAVLHGATCFVAYLIVFEILRRQTPAFLGALVCAVNPLLAAHTVDFFTETLHTVLWALGVLFVVRVLKNGKLIFLNAAVAGFAFGLATLCRPSALGVALCLLPVICWLKIKDAQRLRYFAASLVILAATFATVLPWTFHNYRATGEFILVNDGFSYNLWLGSLPETIRIYEGGYKDAADNQRFADYIWGEVQRTKLAELEKTDNYSSLTFNERERVWRREATENIQSDYNVAWRIAAGKIWTFWTPFLNPLTYGWKIVALVALFVTGCYLLGLYGSTVFWGEKTGKELLILLAVSFVAATAIHVLIMGFVRYRIPYVDPYFSMLTGVALWHLGAKIVRTRSDSNAATAGIATR